MMKKINSYDLKICAFQATIFEQPLMQTECSSKIFIRRYMNSDFATRMDLNGALFESYTNADAFNEIDNQYGKTSYGRIKYSKEEMYWIGYIYRYWAITYGKSSKWLFKKIKPEELRELYFAYHSLDPAQAISRIIEAKGIEEKDQIAGGAENMRMIRQRMSKKKSHNTINRRIVG